jgi:ElaB/YqjD/DUF883 family membrane-anchored ribosome-binding protein
METSRTQKTDAERNIERASKGAHQAVDRAADMASSVAERVGDKRDELWEMQENWVEGARDYVREHPIAALGMALAAGYLLSMIMRGRG